MKLPSYLIVVAAFGMQFAVNSGEQAVIHAQAFTQPNSRSTPEQIAKIPVRALLIKDFQLLDSNTGWVSTGNRLLFTTDNGGHWKDISPPNPGPGGIDNVDFLDDDNAWVLYYVATWEDDADFVLSSTTNGGATWAATKIKIPLGDPAQGAPELAGGGSIAFADKLRGWLLFRYQTGSAFNSAGFLATTDGGRTWHETNENPGFAGEIRAYPNGDVWVSGHPGVNEEGKTEELVVSRKGGDGFEDVSLPAPKELGSVGEPSSYTLPVFESSLHGYEVASYHGPNDANSTAVLFETLDGGRTWQVDRTLSSLKGSGRVESTVADSTWIVPYAPPGRKPTLVKLRPKERRIAPDHKNSGDFSNCKLTFFTADDGWINCSGVLFSTIDGGMTLTDIAPRARNGVLTTDPVTPVKSQPVQMKKIAPQLVPNAAVPAQPPISLTSGVDQHLGFDKDYVISVQDMQKWWYHSPYYDMGIYLPGSPSGPHTANPGGNKPKLDSDWIASVSTQGWGLIPIWSGLQAPCGCAPATKKNPNTTFPTCNHFGHTFSKVAAEAEQDGKDQADKAIASAIKLGLDGSIIYVDIENYASGYTFPKIGATCGAATRAYVSGWVEEMHSQAGFGSAGVYGGTYNAHADFYRVTQRPDEAYISYSDKRVTVFHLNHGRTLSSADLSGALEDLEWPNRQRIHQYRIPTVADPAFETWGGAGPYQLDNDLVDARVVPSSGTRQYNLQGTEVDDGGIAGINNGANNGANLPMGTLVGPATGGGVVLSNCPLGAFIDSAAKGISSVPGLSSYECAGVSGINNLGQVIGVASDIGGFLYTPGPKPSLIPLPGVPSSINDAGWLMLQPCMIIKPPYTNPVSFDYIGPFVCDGQNSGVMDFWGSGMLAINGLGQISGTEIEWTSGTGIDGTDTQVGASVFVDDIESGTPVASDQVSVLATTQGTYEYLVAGINNNGQVAGTYVPYGGFDFSQGRGFFINTDGSVDSFTLPVAATLDFVSGLNDDVQMVGAGCADTNCNGWVGFTIDTQH